MSSARVTSIDALRDFKTALIQFGLDAKEALGAAEIELRRITEWLDQQLSRWRKVVREQEEEVIRAKADLTQRKYAADGRGYTEQEIALTRAQRRLQEAQTRLENTRRWIRELPREIEEYQGPARVLGGMLDADLNRTIAHLERRIQALEAYVQLRSGTESSEPAAPAPPLPSAPAAAKSEGASNP